MKIGFDAKRLFLNKTGLGNYSRTLVRNLVKYYPDNTYFLYSPKVERNEETEFFFDKANIKIVVPKNGGGAAWRSRGVLKEIQRDNIDIYHGLSNELPYGISKLEVKSIVTIHDVIFERYPKQYAFFDRLMYRHKTKSCIGQADRILSISHQTTHDLKKYYSVPENKITLIYQTCNPTFTDTPTPFKPKSNDYFLYVGSIIERKNLLSILEAMTQIEESSRKKLIIAGTGSAYFKKVKSYAAENRLEPWLEWKGVMSNRDLRELYENSIALIYPSIFEGFGIPVIESMFAGRPVITSNLSSLKEAGGEAAILIDPFKVSELVDGMNKVVSMEYQKDLEIRIGKHLQKFNPEKLSSQLMDLYQSPD